MSNDTLLERVNKALGKEMGLRSFVIIAKELVNLVERQQKELASWEQENGAMAEKHAEKDIFIEKLIEENRALKQKTWYPVYKENLRLAEEIERLKCGVTV